MRPSRSSQKLARFCLSHRVVAPLDRRPGVSEGAYRAAIAAAAAHSLEVFKAATGAREKTGPK